MVCDFGLDVDFGRRHRVSMTTMTQPTVPLEDFACDILGKAMRGLNVSTQELAELSGVAENAIAQLLDEEAFDAEAAAMLAPHLNLHGPSLVGLGQNKWQPAAQEIEGLAQFNTPYPGMTVNAYVAWSPGGTDALIFDTGSDASGILKLISDRELNVGAIFLTHTHRDHVMDLDRLTQALPDVPVYVGKLEPVDRADGVENHQRFSFGDLSIESRLTSGHSVGGMSYVISGLERPVAIVGDALFAGSMGGGMISWSDALENNRKQLFTLPDDTVVCPGHGPMSTIAEEKAHNPCYPEYK
ncbi:MAG: hydroxyacylglutathione hydrolase [Verrucomicrobiales bacterium]|jgi:hydroxyacylglutathione hydrolase